MSDTELPAAGGGPGGERCDKCRWWECREERYGECRRYPPRIVGDLVPKVGHEEGIYFRTLCPMTGRDDYCGEFRPRAGEKKAGELAADILDAQIDTLDIPSRERNRLAVGVVERYGVYHPSAEAVFATVRNLIDCTAHEVSKFRGVGANTVQEVRLALRKHGLYLKGDYPA